VYPDNAGPHTARMTLEFLKHNGMKKHLIHHIHLIWHRLTFSSSATSRNSWQGTNSPIRKHFSRQSDTFWRALKKLPWIGFFSREWRDSSDGLKPMESTLSKEQFDVKMFYW
jgi:hypothetical protein